MRTRSVFLAAAVILAVGVGVAAGEPPTQAQSMAELTARLKDLQERVDAMERSSNRQELTELADELRTKAKEISFPGWMENLKLYADLRLRYNFDCFNTDAHERNRARFRLRFGATKTWLDKQIEAGFRFASGSSEDPTSTNQTMTDGFGEKDLWIDLAYAKIAPKEIPGFMAVGGKMKNPFVCTNMLWDSDVNPEGVWFRYDMDGIEGVKPFAGVGFFVLEYNKNAGDATMHAYQVGATIEALEGIKWTPALAYYDYGNYERPGNFNGRDGNNSESGGRLTAEEFNIVNLVNKVGFEAFGLPMSAYVDYAHNCQSEVSDTDDALAVGITVGKNKKAGDWSAKYKYAYIEANAVAGAFSDSDFGQANRKGHQWGAAYNITDFLTFGLNLFYTQPVSGSDVGDTKFSLLADLIWKI